MGINEYGEIGINGSKILNTPSKLTFFEEKNLEIKKVCSGSRHSIVLTENYKLYAFGDNSEGQCSGKTSFRSCPKAVKFMGTPKIIDIYVGINHNVALSDKGDVYTWGETSSGKLGYNNFDTKQIYPNVIPFLKCKNISVIGAGPMQTCLVTSNFNNSLVHTYNTININ
jgi:alpha-tubulin suppressor-like RCC1 family protein